jgi:Immunoglobulin-like domain of bacterial spore germination
MRLTFLLALLGAAALVAACDDDDGGGVSFVETATEDDEEETATATPTASETPTETATPEPTETPVEDVCAPNPSPVDASDPSIIVTSPTADLESAVANPIEVTGQARVFEANVSISLFGPDGEALTETFATATVAGPDFGDFEALIGYAGIDEEAPACLWVFEASAEDGSPNNVVQIPLLLSPAPEFVSVEGGGWCPPNPDPASAENFVVDDPQPGDTEIGAVRVQGEAAVFEAQFLVRIYDYQGNVLVEQPASTAEGGVLSPFDVGVPFTVDQTQPGCVWAFEASAADGSDTHIYAVPVHLAH